MRLTIVLLFLFLSAQAFGQTWDAPNVDPGVGVKPYREAGHGPIRASVSMGFDAGYAYDLPLAVLERISYSFGPTEVAVAALEAAGSNGLPRKSLDEFDILYGVGVEPLRLTPDVPSERFHVSALVGVAFVGYQERYRRRFRGAPIDSTLPPNVALYSAGLPIRLSATYEPFRFAGLGLDLFWTVSNLRPSYGAALRFQTGWF